MEFSMQECNIYYDLLHKITAFIKENKLKTNVDVFQDIITSHVPKDEIDIYNKGVSDILNGLIMSKNKNKQNIKEKV